ncbi:MAG: LON peptidase substrate-binding domain-containing protein [Planctomycetota bacterium]|nr:LON peptidase substrate-binding domain-containing protein [Planctomycetota bacterium]
MGLFLPNQFDVPVFPLPGVVLFPGTVMPLHIFEPRYRALLQDALAGEKLIAMGNLREGWQTHYHGRPPIHEVLGVGRIAACQELQDGTYNIALVGVARCQVRAELPETKPYRVAQVALLKDLPLKGPDLQRESKEFRDALCEVAGHLIRRSMKPEAREVMEKSLLERQEAGQAADFLAGVFLQEPSQRQRLLENIDTLARCREVTALIERMLSTREPEGPPITGRIDEISLN